MKAALLAAALATLVGTQAQASWAENANKQYPVYTGTDAALARAQGVVAQAARELGLSPNTVKQHASSIFRKLGVRNRAEAVRRADELGLLAA